MTRKLRSHSRSSLATRLPASSNPAPVRGRRSEGSVPWVPRLPVASLAHRAATSTCALEIMSSEGGGTSLAYAPWTSLSEYRVTTD